MAGASEIAPQHYDPERIYREVLQPFVRERQQASGDPEAAAALDHWSIYDAATLSDVPYYAELVAETKPPAATVALNVEAEIINRKKREEILDTALRGGNVFETIGDHSMFELVIKRGLWCVFTESAQTSVNVYHRVEDKMAYTIWSQGEKDRRPPADDKIRERHLETLKNGLCILKAPQAIRQALDIIRNNPLED